jgi:HAD superfamily hydrolase (TIGR01490 family)
MHIALFDLDHTLLDGDTNVLWLDYLAQRQLIPQSDIEQQRAFMVQYDREELDILVYLDFHVRILQAKTLTAWQPIVADFLAQDIQPRISNKALETLSHYQASADRVAMVTGTNSFLAGAIGQLLQIETIAPVLEVNDDCFTGRLVGIPSFREQKIPCVESWLGCALGDPNVLESHFYSDSMNDLPLLSAVTHAFVVNPDSKLARIAEQKQWPSLDWRVK